MRAGDLSSVMYLVPVRRRTCCNKEETEKISNWKKMGLHLHIMFVYYTCVIIVMLNKNIQCGRVLEFT